jgi:hypothetical protein
MTIYVDVNSQYYWRILQDLQTICADPNLMHDSTTGLWYLPPRGGLSTGCDFLADLANRPYTVRIRAEGGGFGVGNMATPTLRESLGTLVQNTPLNVPATMIEVIYDGSDCDGKGAWVARDTNHAIPAPTHVTLLHELVHAFRAGEGLNAWKWDTQVGPDGGLIQVPVNDSPREEEETIQWENSYRQSIGLPLRATSDTLHWAGGCNPPPSSFDASDAGQDPQMSMPPKKYDPFNTGNPHCFVATAAYGSSLAPEVAFLRRFREETLLPTRVGRAFFDAFHAQYYRFSPAVVALMRQDPEARDLIRRTLVTPLVRYLELAVRFPNAPLDGVPEPWRAFLAETRDGLADWTSMLPLPGGFADLPSQAAADELAIALRYLLRTARARQSYLDRLERDGDIPLASLPAEREALGQRLRAAGVADADIVRILCGREGQRTCGGCPACSRWPAADSARDGDGA